MLKTSDTARRKKRLAQQISDLRPQGGAVGKSMAFTGQKEKETKKRLSDSVTRSVAKKPKLPKNTLFEQIVD